MLVFLIPLAVSPSCDLAGQATGLFPYVRGESWHTQGTVCGREVGAMSRLVSVESILCEFSLFDRLFIPFTISPLQFGRPGD